jgi:uncharacterized repeat protein (TIGR03843 family)
MSGLERAPADPVGVSQAETLEILRTGAVTVLGLIPYSSNYTFLARVERGKELLAVYKPRRGERPLWDFPAGSLAPREVAAWLVSEAAGWGIVPATVLREDAPLGDGSLQLFIEHDPDRHYFVLMEESLEEFAVFAAFDAVINNADRKAGHVIEDGGGRLWAVDHGVSFNVDPKLRTVIWQFAGERLGPQIRAALESLGAELAGRGDLYTRISDLLSRAEADATLARIEALLVEDRFPQPGGDRPLPWPLI